MNNKNIITQTNRTILFEEINPEKPDLITLIDDVKGMDSLSDEKIIENALLPVFCLFFSCVS